MPPRTNTVWPRSTSTTWSRLTQVLALLSLENGLFLAAISLTYGMPLIVELGVFFDVLVAVLVLAILVYRIRESYESMDVSEMRRLRG
jgi:hydrogenase-4 component E